MATAIIAASRFAAPIIGRTPCTSATSSATISAKWPISGITALSPADEPKESLAGLLHARERHRRFLLRLGDSVLGLGGHVVLVVLGEHFRRVERSIGTEPALCDHAFAFLEEVGQQAR